MDRRSIQDIYLKTEQLPYIHILTLNLLLKESQQVGRKRNYRDMEISHAPSVRIVEKKYLCTILIGSSEQYELSVASV
jgi:hypothetical protein